MRDVLLIKHSVFSHNRITLKWLFGIISKELLHVTTYRITAHNSGGKNSNTFLAVVWRISIHWMLVLLDFTFSVLFHTHTKSEQRYEYKLPAFICPTLPETWQWRHASLSAHSNSCACYNSLTPTDLCVLEQPSTLQHHVRYTDTLILLLSLINPIMFQP